MRAVTPESPEDLASALAGAASRKQTITLGGRGSKNKMGGPVAVSDVTVTTTGLTRVLSYEPNDLTISVEAGVPWAAFTKVVADDRRRVSRDPPFSGAGTWGGVAPTHCSRGRRRL